MAQIRSKYPHQFVAGNFILYTAEPIQTSDQILGLVNKYSPDFITLPRALSKPDIAFTALVQDKDQFFNPIDHELLGRRIIRALLKKAMIATSEQLTVLIHAVLRANTSRILKLEYEKQRQKDPNPKELTTPPTEQLEAKWQFRDAAPPKDETERLEIKYEQDSGYPYLFKAGVFTFYTAEKVKTVGDIIRLANAFLKGLPDKLNRPMIKCRVKKPNRLGIDFHPDVIEIQIGLILLEKAIPMLLEESRILIREVVQQHQLLIARLKKQKPNSKIPPEKKLEQMFRETIFLTLEQKELIARRRIEGFLVPNLHFRPDRCRTLNIFSPKSLPSKNIKLPVIELPNHAPLNAVLPNLAKLCIDENVVDEVFEIDKKLQVDVKLKVDEKAQVNVDVHVKSEYKKFDIANRISKVDALLFSDTSKNQIQEKPIEINEQQVQRRGLSRLFCCSSSG